MARLFSGDKPIVCPSVVSVSFGSHCVLRKSLCPLVVSASFGTRLLLGTQLLLETRLLWGRLPLNDLKIGIGQAKTLLAAIFKINRRSSFRTAASHHDDRTQTVLVVDDLHANFVGLRV